MTAIARELACAIGSNNQHDVRPSLPGGRVRVALGVLVSLAGAWSTAVSAQSSPPPSKSDAVSAYAAGSLREVMGVLEKGFADEQRGKRNVAFEFLYGPSGRLRERIESGDRVQLFASASPTHTEKLVESGKLRSSTLFASNSLCALFRDDLRLTEQNFVETLLSAQVRLGTSTPGADPSGDYTWDMFRKIGAAQRGAFEALDQRALKLTGAEVGNQASNESPYAKLLGERKADVFITYCTNAMSARKAAAGLQSIKVPAQFDVAASYAIGIAPGASDNAREFLRYVLSQRAQTLMAGLGFSPPPLKCERVDDALQAAHTAWLTASRPVTSGTGAPGAPPPSVIESGQKLAMGLHAGNSLGFVKRPQGAMKDRFGGSLSYTATGSGHIEVFLDRRGWIDVVRLRDQKALESLRAERWLGCAGVGKNLGFMVEKGERYELRLSEIETPHVDVLLVPMNAQPAAGTAAPAPRSGS